MKVEEIKNELKEIKTNMDFELKAINTKIDLILNKM